MFVSSGESDAPAVEHSGKRACAFDLPREPVYGLRKVRGVAPRLLEAKIFGVFFPSWAAPAAGLRMLQRIADAARVILCVTI